ncbi:MULTISPECIES: phage tail assembly chaperone [Pseudomonas]|uniref:phage tail assembly chaperone n=1 Tax=Pseudomonas TaxID=286 RepID=UPI001474BADD|nr:MULTISPECIES: phage tail assembly chaperone [Pseudomonas]MCU0211648.1 phage tail assembly chaperone [Pseudomonas shahriarae]NMY23114.1 phage tail protein [Pseudomonas sp. WS 5410]
MKFYFSPSTTTFFRSDIHGEPGSDDCSIPYYVREVSVEVFERMSRVRQEGGRVVPDEEGLPIAAPALLPTSEQLAETERRWRDQVISTSEWIVTRHRDEVDMGQETQITPEQFSELLRYRQSLRDWPTAEGFPAAELRPTPPDWLAAQAE